MIVRVRYHNGVSDIVGSDCLQSLLNAGKVKEYYSYSEKKWVLVDSASAWKKIRMMAYGAESEKRDTYTQNISTECLISMHDIQKLRRLFDSTSSLNVHSNAATTANIIVPKKAGIERRTRWLMEM